MNDTNLQAPIAVVGVSALFPGSLDATGFWRDILAGRDLITDVPESHWLIEDYYDPDPSAPDKTYAKRGAFLKDIDFDALSWGIPPNIIPATDTSQLLALIVAQRVLEDAANGQFETMDRSRMSVILGVTSGQELLGNMVSRLQRPIWVKAMRDAGLPETEVEDIAQRIADHYVPWQESSFPGLLGNVVAGRIANRLDLGGTNCVVDAACASSLSALSMGVNELRLGTSDVVVTGGVDTLNDIFMYMCFSKTPALSPSGDCRPFSDQADGTMLGEGLGMVALKRLADAERDGDRVYAVIKGIGSSSDGRSKSVYAPVSSGQAKALSRAYDQAGYSPTTVELVEAHGTGTIAGDAAEFAGLKMVFDDAGREDRQWCALGSVKSQIGHTKSAAGAAGLFKTVMALHHKVLAPTSKVDRPNPKLGLDDSPFYLNTHARPWIRSSEQPRRASVSAFGFGGSNFHVALEEYTGPAARPGRRTHFKRQLVLICGDDGAAVAQRARAMVATATAPGGLAWLSQSTLAAYDPAAGARLALLASDEAALADKLASIAARIEAAPNAAFKMPDGTTYSAEAADTGSVAFLFPGQGSQYVGMGADLAISFDAARGPWDHAAGLQFDPALPLQEVVFARPGFATDKAATDQARLTQTEWAQPALGCSSLAALELLRQIGLAPAMVAGHSFGEVTALHAAGVIDAQALLTIARKRGELMAAAASQPGAMTVARTTVEVARELIASHSLDVTIANHNGPTQVVLSGRTEAIAALEAHLAEQGIDAKRLNVATAFHSPVVAGSSAPFADFLADVEFAEASVPVYSNQQAAPYAAGAQAKRQGLAEQIANSVRFVEMVEAMYAAGARTFVEVGPGGVLSALVGQILGDRPHRAIALDRKGSDGVDTLLAAIGRLASAGVVMTPSKLWDGYEVARDPATVKQPKLALPISGSNSGKPYPPKGGAAALPAPNPPRLAPAPAPQPMLATPTAAVPQPVLATPTAAVSQPVMTMPSAPAPQPMLAATPLPSVPAAPGFASDGPTEGWLGAFQETQRQTAEAHACYQQAMAQSHQAFLQLAETSLRGLSGLLGGTAPVATSVRADRPSVAAPLQPAPITFVAPLSDDGATSVPPKAPSVSPAQNAFVAEPVMAPVVVAAAAPTVSPSVDLNAIMLAVVADKTGYPEDMLDFDMDIEGELGIDSIKRVEILAEVQELAPGMPEIDAARMGALNTLGEIVTYMQSLMGPSVPMAPSPSGASEPAAAIDLNAIMLAVVADKTGYPEDMLDFDMDIEGELGIDSIKRV
ncbi:MAG: polyketide-type polyunsaturated fatty acid synthase PfaA, partial [Myxococcota bacterium]